MNRQVDLTQAIETFKEELATVDEILPVLKQEVARYESERIKIMAARKALDEDHKPPNKKGTRKPAPTKIDVAAALVKNEAAGIRGEDEVKAAVESEISKSGFSKAGLSLRLAEVLRESAQHA